MGRKRKKARKKKEFNILKRIAGDVSGISLISDMEEVQVFPTLLTGYNRATGIGGHPRGRVTVIHGPNQVGKTVLALALAESARRCGDAVFVHDPEFAAEKDWYNTISPKSGFSQPPDLDTLFGTTQTLLNRLEKAKKAKRKADRIAEETGCFFVVDTLTKLMPANILEQIEKEGIDKQYPIQALHVSMWMKSIVPQLARTNSSMVLVLQERAAVGALPNQKKYKVTLGNAVQYDNCVRVRVTHAKRVKRGDLVIGSEAFYTVENNKIDGTSFEKSSFFTSNGKGDVPKGLDLVREAIAEGRLRKWLEKEKDHILVTAPGVEYDIEGGWSDLREFLMENPRDFRKFVKKLNSHARRQ